jgi:predicted metalloprotease with PDZ domain
LYAYRVESEVKIVTWQVVRRRAPCDCRSLRRGHAARAPDGTSLRVEQPAPNRWRVFTGRRPSVVVSYQLACQKRSVTTNWVDDTLAVLNGAPTFVTLAETAHRPHEVRLQLARMLDAVDDLTRAGTGRIAKSLPGA